MAVSRWLGCVSIATVAATLVGRPYTGESFNCPDPDRRLGCPDAATPVDSGPGDSGHANASSEASVDARADATDAGPTHP